VGGRVGHELASEAPDAHGPERAIPGNIADHQRRRGPEERQHIRIMFAIGAEHDALDLHLIVPTFGEKRADGPVNQARGENFLFGGAAFAFEITAWEFAGGSRFFPVIYRQGKEIMSRFGFGGADGCDYDDALP